MATNFRRRPWSSMHCSCLSSKSCEDGTHSCIDKKVFAGFPEHFPHAPLKPHGSSSRYWTFHLLVDCLQFKIEPVTFYKTSVWNVTAMQTTTHTTMLYTTDHRYVTTLGKSKSIQRTSCDRCTHYSDKYFVWPNRYGSWEQIIVPRQCLATCILLQTFADYCRCWCLMMNCY